DMGNQQLQKKTGAVLVIGGGIAGIQASLDLAEMGINVHLLEEEPSIGGRMAKLDKTFPTNDCAMCILSPKLVEVGAHPRISLLTNARLDKLSGAAGSFRATITKLPRYVDVEKCTACGICMEKCPVKINDAFNAGLSTIPAIRVPFPQAIPAAAIIDAEHCLKLTKDKCGICEKVCDAGAVDYSQKAEEIELDVASVILALGSGEFDPHLRMEYGYGLCPNVITSLEYERLLCASGPTGGHVSRPSDGKEPKRIAFVQCVGSRDRMIGNPYCSSMCCMQATKDAIVTSEHIDSVSATIFYIDLRAHGKGFDGYVERAKDEYGVRYIQSRVTGIKEDGEGNLILKYVDEKEEVQKETFDLVVLSIGLRTNPRALEMARKLGIELDESNFCRAAPFSGVRSSRDGIFICGTIAGPKDIPESVIEASAAASGAAGYIIGPGYRAGEAISFPPETDVSGMAPRIGVYICRCGINIGGVVDVPAVVEYARGLKNVVHTDEMIYACSQDALSRLEAEIKEHGLNRVVVASCSPRTHEPLFRRTMRRAGLNQYLFEMANIRDQCSWVHMDDKDAATEKSKELVGMAAAKAARLDPLEQNRIEIKDSALVIGAGVAGMNAALTLAGEGFKVHLIEKEDVLGGNARRFYGDIYGNDVAGYVEKLCNEIAGSENISLYAGASIEDVSGHIGNFKTTVALKSEDTIELEHGVIILATGGEELIPDEYGLGENPDVVTVRQFEHMLRVSHPALKRAGRIVFIGCVAQRNKERTYCSRICCAQAMKTALAFKKASRKREAYFLYRDIRTYGISELYYGEARELGVNFIRYEPERAPAVERIGEDTIVTVYDPILGEYVRIEADLVILATPIVGPTENRKTAKLLKVPVDGDNFFLEAHVKLRPVDFASDGIFLCGLAHGPKTMAESIAQAKAAAGRAATILTRDVVEAEGAVARVNEERCTACSMCVNVCPYNSISLDEEKRVAVVDGAVCKGCGTCAAACLSGAIDLKGFSNDQIAAAVEELARV
ncbi:MAG: CoB--CoM heterodisulfide reductase iron-sulfur subunit A family protein, partial [Candidatus Tritonobacter lacicola]|nr:CoB--CoM heterodisulfide reductase iron-sulfur subunit A family protein [Candidatus Tritonobacter lacicola]